MMKLLRLAIAASVVLGAAGAASAQDRWHDGGRWSRDHRGNGAWHGRGWHRGWGYARHCRIVWRHHYRQRICWR
jgi:hypothetical protein